MKQSAEHLESYEIIDLPDTALFELRLVVAMENFDSEENMTAAEWLHNISFLARSGEDISILFAAFSDCVIVIGERRVHLCNVERIER